MKVYIEWQYLHSFTQTWKYWNPHTSSNKTPKLTIKPHSGSAVVDWHQGLSSNENSCKVHWNSDTTWSIFSFVTLLSLRLPSFFPSSHHDHNFLPPLPTIAPGGFFFGSLWVTPLEVLNIDTTNGHDTSMLRVWEAVSIAKEPWNCGLASLCPCWFITPSLINLFANFFFTALEQDDDRMRTKDQVVKRCVYVHVSYYRPKVISIIIPYYCGPLFVGCATIVECLAPKQSLSECIYSIFCLDFSCLL